MAKIDVVLLPEELKKRELTNHLVVVIDVLRVSSTITTALAAGVSKIIPIRLPEEAFRRKEAFLPGQVLLCGERNGKKPSGFDLGNSPLEYSSKKVRDKTILLTSTNGIRTIKLVERAEEIIIGCFLNIEAIIQYCRTYSGNVLLVCAGDKRAVSLADTVCAGMIKSLYEEESQNNKNIYDDSLIACRMYREFSHNLLHMMKVSKWGQGLIALGLEQDLAYCAQKNIFHIVPVIKDESIVSIDFFGNYVNN